MANAAVYTRLGVVEMDATNSTYAPDSAEGVETIVFTGTAAGTFTAVIDGFTLTITTGTGQLSFALPFNRTVKSVVVSAVATGGKVLLMLRKRA